MNALKSIGGIILGLFLGWLVIQGIESISHSLYGTIDFSKITTLESLKIEISKMPLGSFWLIIIGHFLGVFISGFACFMLSKNVGLSFVPMTLFALATLVNVILIPHPMWFTLTDVFGALLGMIVCWMWIKNKSNA